MTLRSILGSTQACIAMGFAMGAAAILISAEPVRAAPSAPEMVSAITR